MRPCGACGVALGARLAAAELQAGRRRALLSAACGCTLPGMQVAEAQPSTPIAVAIPIPVQPPPVQGPLASLRLSRHEGASGRAPVTVQPAQLMDKIVALYFSAHWCPPCRGFTPQLREWYDAVRKSGGALEVVFVSADRSAKEMAEYMRQSHGRWVSLEWADRSSQRELSERYGVQGLPTLVAIEPRSGRVVSAEGRADVGRGVGSFARWEQAAAELPQQQPVTSPSHGECASGSGEVGGGWRGAADAVKAKARRWGPAAMQGVGVLAMATGHPGLVRASNAMAVGGMANSAVQTVRGSSSGGGGSNRNTAAEEDSDAPHVAAQPVVATTSVDPAPEPETSETEVDVWVGANTVGYLLVTMGRISRKLEVTPFLVGAHAEAAAEQALVALRQASRMDLRMCVEVQELLATHAGPIPSLQGAHTPVLSPSSSSSSSGPSQQEEIVTMMDAHGAPRGWRRVVETESAGIVLESARRECLSEAARWAHSHAHTEAASQWVGI